MSAPVIVSYGAGTNSTALLVGLVERGEWVDAIVFADTGGERPETYAYVEMFSAWLVGRGYPAIETTRRAHNDGETLEANCLRYGKLPAVAYGFKTCSTEYKRRPVERWTRARYPTGDVVKVLGYDADEPDRATRAKPDNKRTRIRFPLIEWGWGREECIEAILRVGLPLPGKSACFFCPNTTVARIIDLARTHPPLFARAVAMEKRAKEQDIADGTTSEIVGLSRDYTWQDIVSGDMRQVKLFRQDEPCDCYDGGDE